MYDYIRKIIQEKKRQKFDRTRTVWRNCVPTDPQMQKINEKLHNRVKTSRYEIWNFVPLVLIEQFQKLANFYFLVLVAILFALGSRAPLSPITTILPLIFVVTLAALKQAYEDYNRHKSDDQVNKKIIMVLKGNKFVRRPASSIMVGDIVRIENEEEFPCDLVMLSSSNVQGSCYITTANFDGETNLKTRRCVSETIILQDDFQLKNLSCILEYEKPNHDLYKFTGKISLKENSGSFTQMSLSTDNFLFRGAHLKNTEYINGIAVYIGPETKLALNQQEKRRKVSIVDKKLNQFILFMILVLVVGSAILTILYYAYSLPNIPWYMSTYTQGITAFDVFADIFSFVSLLNNVIPISLYVTIELQKFTNATFIDWDLDLYHEPTDDPAHSNTSDIIEELGQIEYIFTDKTGTLTENQMDFKKCIIGDNVYLKGPTYIENKTRFNVSNMTPELLNFFIYVCICHSAEVEILTDPVTNIRRYKYMSYSPDEVSLLEASNSLGMIFNKRSEDNVYINYGTKDIKFAIKNILSFDPTRKRMSVIFENNQGEIILICKGADSHVLPLCDNSHARDVTSRAIDEFARDGFRTLTYAYKYLTQEQYMDIKAELSKAELAIVDREQLLSEVYEKIENNLNVIGATAVDDKLQDGVEESFKSFRDAGINVWVLTGDKEETAVSISLKCGHLLSNMDILYLCQRVENISVVLDEYIRRIKTMPNTKFAVVIDGHTLKVLMEDYVDKIKIIFINCQTALCCRMSPLQKSKVVNFIRTKLTNRPVTLAVGDGANDCSMIQEAHVGVGIMGKEGRQAVYVSDYALHRFKYLQKLVLFHGYCFYTRIVMTIHYFFYKNIMVIAPMYAFVFFTYYSPSSLYSDAQITMYNAVCTAFPVLFFGVLEQPYSKYHLLHYPATYRELTRNSYMTWLNFMLWCLNGIWQSMAIFVWSMLAYNQGYVNIPDQYFDFSVYGTMVYTYVLLCVTIQLLLISRFWTIHLFVSVIGSFVFYVISASVISTFYAINPTSNIFSTMYNSFYTFFNMLMYPHFWVGIVVIVPLAFFPYIIIKFIIDYIAQRNPAYTEDLQENDFSTSARFQDQFNTRSNLVDTAIAF